MKKITYITPIPDFIFDYFKNISNGIDYGKPIDTWKLLWYKGQQFVYVIPPHTEWSGRLRGHIYKNAVYNFVDLNFAKGIGYNLHLSATIAVSKGRTDIKKFIETSKEKVQLLLQKNT